MERKIEFAAVKETKAARDEAIAEKRITSVWSTELGLFLGPEKALDTSLTVAPSSLAVRERNLSYKNTNACSWAKADFSMKQETLEVDALWGVQSLQLPGTFGQSGLPKPYAGKFEKIDQFY